MRLADLQIGMRDNVVVAGITGELDLSNAESLGSRLIARIPAETRGIVLDLSGVSYIDSVGIAVTVGIRETLLERGQQLALVIPETSRVNAVLQLVGLGELIRRSETVEEALTALDRDDMSGPGPSE